MGKSFTYALCSFLFLFISCNTKDKKERVADQMETGFQYSQEHGAQIIAEAIKAHGGDMFDMANYQFTFRNKLYTFNNTNGYTYTVSWKDSLGTMMEDILLNGNFIRKIKNDTVPLSKADVTKYSNALNSVIYFATLPYKLKDKAVHKKYIKEAVIKGEEYDVIEVTFEKIGGGEDYDDVFCYWVNKKSHYINYLAYKYSTNGGGVRFRSAYNPRTIDGIRFQNYINWEAPLGTSLQDLPELYVKDELKELSKIETEAIQNLRPITEE